jgi:DNA mismatch endonuclease (patch repair protein)
LPKSRLDFWLPKLEANRERDNRNHHLLEAQGWRILVIWECELSDPRAVKSRVRNFLTR